MCDFIQYYLDLIYWVCFRLCENQWLVLPFYLGGSFDLGIARLGLIYTALILFGAMQCGFNNRFTQFDVIY